MDEPAFPGCKLTCRIVGVIEGEQGGKKDTERASSRSKQLCARQTD